MRRFLTENEEQTLQAERQQLGRLRNLMAQLEAAADDLKLLDRALTQLDDLFLLVIVGEFNAGKSAFINALLGERFLVEGVTPTTTQVHVLRYGPEVAQSRPEPDLLILNYPVEWLREINIVDTPGTNAIMQRHQQITEEFVPRADLVLFVTSADRPFSESERAFIQRIREWGKKVVLVINKIDILETPADVENVVQFVEQNGRLLLGREPVVFPVSARMARQAKTTADADERVRLWDASRFGPLEDYVLNTLDEKERLRLKLSSPLGIGQRLVAQYLSISRARATLLREDVVTVQSVEQQLETYESDMRRDFKYHLSHVDNGLYAMAERGNRFFDETIRVGRILDLVNAERIRGAFEREVVADTSAEVEAATHELIDWLVDQDFRQWQAVMEYLNRRVAMHQDRLIGQVGGQFAFNRQALLQSVGRAARETVQSYDKDAEARQLAESVQVAVAQTALIEVSAVGIGALLVKLLATTLADITGVFFATALAAVGLYVIPNKRQRAKLDLSAKIADLRGRLGRAMSAQFEKELSGSLERIRNAMRPYTRFVEAQTVAVADAERSLLEVQGALQELEARIEAL